MRIRIEKRSSWDRGSFEANTEELAPDARTALETLLAHSAPSADPPGGDQPWYRVTVTGADGEHSLDVAAHAMPEALAILPRPRIG